jgi:hypothetical protein
MIKWFNSLEIGTQTELACPKEHTEPESVFLDTCEKFLIVGLSGWYTDFLQFLASAVARPAAMVHLVCPGNERIT